ncbi:hypothetical protein DIPPA_24491 [Diplonema papillatum]|nr:hypothetical protein DIPPA_24491 [Diplonema papillatum]
MVGGRSVLRSYPVPPAGGQIAGQPGMLSGGWDRRRRQRTGATASSERSSSSATQSTWPICCIVVAGVEGGGCIYKVQGETGWRPAVTVAELEQDDDGYYLLFRSWTAASASATRSSLWLC